MTIDADACTRELVEAYDSGDFQALLKIVAFPVAIYVDDEVLVLAHPGELLRFVTLQKIAAFRTKTGRVQCELLKSEMVNATNAKATVRMFSPVMRSSTGNSVVAHMYMGMVDGSVKLEMMEVIDYNPNTPLLQAFRQLNTTKVGQRSISS